MNTKHFLILLLTCLPFFASSQIAEEPLVHIKSSTARYYLETEDERDILLKKDSVSQKIIAGQQQEILLTNKLVDSYKLELDGTRLIGETYFQQFRLKEDEADKLRANLRLKNFLIILITTITILVAI